MAIRALYEIKDAPLALIVDMYKNAMVPSIADEHTPTEAQYQGRLDYAIVSPSLAKKVENGVDGHVSFVGHHDSSYQCGNLCDHYLDEDSSSIWLNERENLHMMDCGCGLPGGRLACICLETGEILFIGGDSYSDVCYF